jgi:hypothetical protein
VSESFNPIYLRFPEFATEISLFFRACRPTPSGGDFLQITSSRFTLTVAIMGYMVYWCRTGGPGEPPKFYPVSNGRTAEEATDRAIERYNRKHGYAQPHAALPDLPANR